MKNNKLYAFITHELNKSLTSSAALQANRFNFKTNLAGSNYALYALSVAPQTTVKSSQGQTYTLNSHHLSFYEKQKDNDPNLSQYHYTAYLTDSKGTEHQLHVYFDHNDTPKAVSLSVAGVEQPISDDVNDIVVQLAEDKSNSVMKELRAQHVNRLDKLETTYNDFESKLSALSSSLATQQAGYQALHEDTQAIVRLLASYHYDGHYEKLLRLFDKISKTLKLSLVKAKAENSGSSVVAPSFDVPASALAVLESKEESDAKKPLRPFVEEAFAAKNRSNSSSSAASLINDILAAHQKVTDLLMLTEDEGYYATSEDLQQIQCLLVEINPKAKKLVLNLLMNKKIEEAEPLHSFVNPTPEKWVRLALVTGNAPMLDFLLRHGNFAINTFVASGNLSSVQFCFQKGATHLDCLSVLIKHKASVMCAAQDGLPIAHHLLADTQHPLRKALIDNTKTTVGQPRFYKALIHKLESHLAEANINIADQAKLLGAVISYKKAIPLLVGSSSRIAQHSLQQRTQIEQNIVSHQAMKGAMEAIKNDPEIRERIQEYQQIFADYNAKLSKTLRRQLGRASTNAYENIERALDYLNPGDFSDAKKNVLTFIKDQIEVTGLRSELLDVQKRLTNFTQSSMGRTRVPRAAKQDAVREKQLVSDIKKHEEKYSFLAADAKQNKKDLACFKNVNSLLEMLNTLQTQLKNFQVVMMGSTITVTHTGDDYLSQLGNFEEISERLDLKPSTVPTQAIAKQPRRLQAPALKNPDSITLRLLIEHSLFSQSLRQEARKRFMVEEQRESNACTTMVPYYSK